MQAEKSGKKLHPAKIYAKINIDLTNHGQAPKTAERKIGSKIGRHLKQQGLAKS